MTLSLPFQTNSNRWLLPGRFLRGVLSDVGTWAKDEKAYKAEVVDKLLPSFLRQWSRSAAMSRNIKPADMLQYDGIKKLVMKW